MLYSLFLLKELFRNTQNKQLFLNKQKVSMHIQIQQLELRQYKNDSIWLQDKLALNLLMNQMVIKYIILTELPYSLE